MDIYNNKSHRAWYHNSIYGRIHVVESTLRVIISSPTTNEAAKRKAETILYGHIKELKEALKQRID